MMRIASGKLETDFSARSAQAFDPDDTEGDICDRSGKDCKRRGKNSREEYESEKLPQHFKMFSVQISTKHLVSAIISAAMPCGSMARKQMNVCQKSDRTVKSGKKRR